MTILPCYEAKDRDYDSLVCKTLFPNLRGDGQKHITLNEIVQFMDRVLEASRATRRLQRSWLTSKVFWSRRVTGLSPRDVDMDQSDDENDDRVRDERVHCSVHIRPGQARPESTMYGENGTISQLRKEFSGMFSSFLIDFSCLEVTAYGQNSIANHFSDNV